jgi:transposase
VLGALNAITHELITVTTDAYINSASVCQLLRQLAALALPVPITVILDNARYQRCRLVQDTAAALKIELLFLPAYSPQFNLIERFWKLVKKCCLHARYYPTFQDFKTSILRFIETAQTEWAANAPLAAASSCPQRSSRRRAAGTIQHCGGAPVAGPTASHNARATASRLKTRHGPSLRFASLIGSFRSREERGNGFQQRLQALWTRFGAVFRWGQVGEGRVTPHRRLLGRSEAFGGGRNKYPILRPAGPPSSQAHLEFRLNTINLKLYF